MPRTSGRTPPPLRGTPGALKGGGAPSIFSPLVRRSVCRTSGLSRLEETRIGRVRFLSRCSSDAGYRTKTEPQRRGLRPLRMLGYPSFSNAHVPAQPP